MIPLFQTPLKLTPSQRALQALALKQLQAASATLQRLRVIPTSQADREAVDDAIDWLSKSDDCLRNWFGGVPSEFADDIAAADD